MINNRKTLNESAWEKLFDKYNILKQVNNKGYFQISAKQIKEFREPRLMSKFDHAINLPKVFTENKLAILPITRGDYVISHFDAYHKFEINNSSIFKVSLPNYIQSLDYGNISSESIALNSAVASGIISDFLEDEDILPTVSGRMSSGNFVFKINNLIDEIPYQIEVNNSQIEIDDAFEGVKSLALFEAKHYLSEDFLVRQLYYPFRAWYGKKLITKPVRTVFLVYSNGIYRLYEYAFKEPNNYNSLLLIKQKNYSIEDTSITIENIQEILYKSAIKKEPNVPFPQADNFDRIVNLCELLKDGDLSRNDVTEKYAFDSRQTNYYADAARYLGLLDKKIINGSPVYSLSKLGKRILGMNYKQRQIAFCNCILSHKPFKDTLVKYLKHGTIPETKEIVQIMKDSKLYNVNSYSTFERRSSTIKGWLNWIVSLVND